MLQGESPGRTEVSVVIAAADNPCIAVSLAAVVEISTDELRVDVLNVVVYTGAVWMEAAESVSLDAIAEPKAQLKSSITREGGTAYIVVYAEFNDGM